MSMNVGFELGTTSLTREVDINELEVDGRVPEWLSGQLLRVGPACFELGDQRYEHWFDGLSMLNRFQFDRGRVTYRNRMLDSTTYRDNMNAGTIRHGEFASSPKHSWRERLRTLWSPDLSDNANVSIAPIGGHINALTETPTPLSFDPETLETIGSLDYSDDIPSTITTAHPLFDAARRETLNYTTAFGRRTNYNIYRLPAGKKRRELISSIPVKRPGYMHSFAATPRFIVLTEWPLTVNPMRLAVSGLTGTPFIDNFCWHGGSESRVLVIDRATGTLVHEAQGPTGFAFHHVNAWEEGDAIVLDVCLYDDATIIDSLRLDPMRDPTCPYPQAALTRFRLEASGQISTNRLTDFSLELPAINYGRHAMYSNRYVYGVTSGPDKSLLAGLAKVDTQDNIVKAWQATNCYPGEPVFTPAPDTNAEDDGVVMSLVLDGAERRSFLLILDAASFEELTRLYLPHAVPFGFHGLFIAE